MSYLPSLVASSSSPSAASAGTGITGNTVKVDSAKVRFYYDVNIFLLLETCMRVYMYARMGLQMYEHAICLYWRRLQVLLFCTYVCMYACKVFSYANVRIYLRSYLLYYTMYVCVGPLCESGLHELLHCHESARFLQSPLRNSHPRHRPARSGYHLS